MTTREISAILLLAQRILTGGKIRPTARQYPHLIVARSENTENVMAFIRLPGGVKVALEFTVGGKVVVNIYHVTTTDPIVTLQLLDLAQVFKAWWEIQIAPNITDRVELFQVTALNLNEENGEKVTLAVIPTVPGTIVSDVVPNNVAAVVTLNTARTGRSYQGRTYLAGLAENEVVINTILGYRVVAILLGMQGLVPLLDAQNSTLVVASFQHNLAPRAEGVATPVDSFSMNDRVDTQRRRLPAS